jgi:hypothetical protein
LSDGFAIKSNGIKYAVYIEGFTVTLTLISSFDHEKDDEDGLSDIEEVNGEEKLVRKSKAKFSKK